jgi:hypothetical protein
MQALLRWYRRRIVNVNINIILAGVLALIPTAAAAHLAEAHFGVDHPLLMAAVTFFVDAVADIAVYYLLHWVANHMPIGGPREPTSAAYGHLPYLHDATLAQFQRMCLSPLLYIIALGGQYALHSWKEVPVVWATAISFIAGILVTRVLHTLWMVRAERQAEERLAVSMKTGAPSGAPVDPSR